MYGVNIVLVDLYKFTETSNSRNTRLGLCDRPRVYTSYQAAGMVGVAPQTPHTCLESDEDW